MTQKYTQKKQYFMNQEVIIIQTYNEELTESQNQWIPIQHFFKALDRLRSDGQVEGTDRNKLIAFITEDLQQEFAVESFNIELGTGSGSIQERDCIRLDVLALAVTQFKPTARKGTSALLIWRTFMNWLNGLLNQVQAHELLVRDKKIEDLEEYVEEFENTTINEYTRADAVKVMNKIRNNMYKDGQQLEDDLIDFEYIKYNHKKEVVWFNSKFISTKIGKKQYKIKRKNIIELTNELKDKRDDKMINDFCKNYNVNPEDLYSK